MNISVVTLSRDARLLFLTRAVRLFAYGFLSVVLVLYLAEAGLTETQIGLLLTLTLIGDTAISLWLTTTADRIGRRKMLVVGAILMFGAGALFSQTRDFFMLTLAATIGVLSPSGNEVGPFLPIEQAALTQLIPAERRTQHLAWYNLVGSFATALGALTAGALAQALQNIGWVPLDSYRLIIILYAAFGLLLAVLIILLSPQTEAPTLPNAHSTNRISFGLHRSRNVIFKLSTLFALDAFAGGFMVQSLLAYWFHLRFGVEPAVLGSIFFGANLLAGISALSAAWVAKHIGLINTMVFTHLPSNVLLMLVPLMPNLPLAITLLLLRFSISQMDVPTRQSYTFAVVEPDERAAAAGVTGVARTIGAALAPLLAAPLFANATLLALPFFICGGLKIVYDLALYREFQAVRPPEEIATRNK